MKQKPIDLNELASEQADELVARLEGDLLDKTEPLWGEEFAASGNGPKSPPLPVGAILYE